MQEDRYSASREDMASNFPRYSAATLGYRNYWYPVALARELRRKPLGRTILGERIAVFRERGKLYALPNRCPHRGVPLSTGYHEFPGTVTCIYHGWTYDLASGKLVAALTDGPDSPICGKVNLRPYPVAERAGLIWVYIGDDAPPPVETDIPDELLQPNTVVEGFSKVQRGNWRYAAENGIDEGHAKYLHRRHSLWTATREMPAWTQIHMAPSDDGQWLVRTGDHVEFADNYPGLGRWPKPPRFWQKRGRGAVRVGIKLPCWLLVQQHGWTGFEVYVPADENHYLSVLLGTCQASGAAAQWFRAKYRAWFRWVFHGQFNGQDQWIIRQMEIPPERLYRPDVSITAWRKLCQEQARGEVQTRGHVQRALTARLTVEV
ncbi:MAG TPA: Rieske 2Fe-2S domain-containing protein [Chloroflexota bacterium]|jgi:phenylpropionate dioxygenase-like ring-hydroxylating dioxygenase large terminal subunit